MAGMSLAQATTMPLVSGPDDSMGADIFTSRSTMPKMTEPNPPFVFPMQPPQVDNTNSGVRIRPVAETTAGSRRSLARTKPQGICVNNLPAFDFHPSGADSTSPFIDSPAPQSPTNTGLPASRASGHRRGGSEFIGGDGKDGGPGLMSTSPTKGEGVLPAPQVNRLGPPGSKRGHAHRRSGAISSHDLSTILRPLNDPSALRSGSAPTTPSDPGINQHFLPGVDRSSSQPFLTSSQSISELPTFRRSDHSPGKSRPRPRVGFSDTIEFIPRPLSSISSDTSSSFSTTRASHSVTGSISSIISGGTSSPPSVKRSQSFSEIPLGQDAARAWPRTAGSVLDTSYFRNSLGGKDAFTTYFSSSPTFPDQSLSVGLPPRDSSPRALNYGISLSPFMPSDAVVEDHAEYSKVSETTIPQLQKKPIVRSPLNRPKSSPVSSTVKSLRKTKPWTGSVLTKKAKLQDADKNSSLCSPSGPPLHGLDNSISLENLSFDNIDFDEDTTCITNDSPNATPRSARIDFSTWKPRQSSPLPDSDTSSTSSPILDLDAALGPFNTPIMGSVEDRTATGGFSSAKRRMHSSGVTGGFAGPGMHYHRRAESAPEMEPVDHQAFGLHHLGSNSAMADVFEEDEESDIPLPMTPEVSEAIDDTVLTGLGVLVVDVGHGDGNLPDQEEPEAGHQDHDKVDVSDTGERPAPEQLTTPARAPLTEEAFPVEIVDAGEEPRTSVVTKSSDECTITPRLSNEGLPRPASAPLTLAISSPGQDFEISQTAPSALSTPDFTNTSFDVPRLNTAHSSVTDRTAWSSSRDQGQSIGYSTDDVPSLTSSASTMISAYPPRISSSGVSRPSGERASSFTAAAPARTRPAYAGKRSSLASLSRLVGGSYGEKSKLSIESRAQHDDHDKPDKKKGNRMSRLMRFWKSKERLDSI
ncbi:MAG: hypothetical protein Q9187_003386 [Circinaria calcarea]